jgi:mannose-1-phosphate guanylyltransferase
MMKRQAALRNLWSIVLAGGEGERIRPLTERWLGSHRPKQYCTFVGTRSLFQHTLDRTDLLTSPDNKAIVIANTHYKEASAQLLGRSAGKLLLQPSNRDTGPGIFLPLTYVRARDPKALVAICPSDHFVYPEPRFIEVVWEAALAAEQLEDRVILLGVRPDRPETEYGWINPGSPITCAGNSQLRAVKSFLEKPAYPEACAAMATGSYWNTFVVVASVGTLWSLGWRCLPEMMPLFECLDRAIGTPGESTVLESIYRVMPSRNFCIDLLQRVPEQVAVFPLTGVLWCDWGRPERIAESLRAIGKQPAFSLEMVAGLKKPDARAPRAMSATLN